MRLVDRSPEPLQMPPEQSSVPDQATATQPDAPLFSLMFEEAVRRQAAGQDSEAEALYRAILAIQPTHAEAHYNLGLICHMQGRTAEAIALYRDALFNRLDYVDAYSNLGTIFKDLGKLDEAILLYRQAIALNKEASASYCNLGVALREQGKATEASAAYKAAIVMQPDHEWAYANLGAVLEEANDWNNAIRCCRRAVRINPGLALAHFNLGTSLKALNRLAEAAESFRAAIALNPDFVEAHFGLAQLLLMQDDFETGWQEYAWRLQLKDNAWMRSIHDIYPRPIWTGEDLHGKSLLIYAEQGMGDAIQYARYIPLILERGATLTLAVHPPLKMLFKAIEGVSVVALDESWPALDFHCPMLNLPRIFETKPDSIPADVPYLRADAAKTERWRARIGGEGLRVGVVWAGNPRQRGDRLRSPRLAAMAPLFDVPGVQFVSLQMGAGREDIAANPLPPHVLDLGEEIEDFSDTAAIMARLDLVITSCTAPLHLAGALGRPTWAMIPFAPHFLWQLDRTDSPWYPSLRLYRQEQPGSYWGDVVARITNDLAALARQQAKRHSA
jgi:tetratricopeptide (TPR) repeat protein